MPRVHGLPKENSSWQLAVCEARVEVQPGRTEERRADADNHSLVKL